MLRFFAKSKVNNGPIYWATQNSFQRDEINYRVPTVFLELQCFLVTKNFLGLCYGLSLISNQVLR